MAGTRQRAAQAHAFTAEAADAQVGRLMRGLEMFCGGPAGLARALRHARKAARSGSPGYDPARHAALLRLKRLDVERDRARAACAGGSRGPAGAGTREQDQRPSNSAVER